MFYLIIFLLAGCNSLFYYPDQSLHGKPNDNDRFEEFTVSSGNEKLHAVRFHHRHKCLGLVVHFHGNAQNLTAHAEFTKWMTEFGFDVLVFDYRGYGLSTGNPSREGLIEDGKSILSFARGLNQCDQLFVIGQSLGGAVAVPSIVLSHVPINAVILDSTFPSYRKIARLKLSQNWFSWLFQWPLSLLITDDYALGDYLGEITQPLIVIHGDRDKIIPVELGRWIFEASVTPCKQFWEHKRLGHIQALTQKETRHRLIDFLNHLEERCPSQNARNSARTRIETQLPPRTTYFQP